MNCKTEADLMRQVLTANLPTDWDGKTCITEMHAASARNWRQMEWIGWYFQWKAFDLLTNNIGGGGGPRYVTSDFDYQRECVWDFKTHVSNAGKPWAILNDASAVSACITQFGSIGFVIATGPAFYNDIQLSFKAWHNSLIGPSSRYVLAGLASGRPSRRRKTNFFLSDLLLVRLDASALSLGMAQGWIKGFQRGMPNSNGKPRTGKVQIHLGRMPVTLLL